MKMYLLVLFATFGLLGADAQIASIGRCDRDVQPIGNFDLLSYLGLWYEIARTPNLFQTGECVTAQYSLSDTAGLVDVHNSIVNDNVLESVTGTARLESDDGSAALIVSFPTEIFEATTSNYWVLDTDYSNYALVYSCQNIGVLRFITVWKLGRTSAFSADVDAHLDGLIDSIDGVSSSNLKYTDHSAEACYVRPENSGAVFAKRIGIPVVSPSRV